MRRIVWIGSVMVGTGCLMSMVSYPFIAGDPASCCSDARDPAWFAPYSTVFLVLILGGCLLLGVALFLQIRNRLMDRSRGQ